MIGNRLTFEKAKMIKLRKLEIEGFRSFEDPVTLDFPESGLVLVTGSYLNSKSQSSGSGKTTVLLGIAYCLGICKLPTTELRNWNSKSMRVSITLDRDGDSIVITRSPKLSIEINGVPELGMSADLESRLQSVLGANEAVLEALVFRPQRTAGKFISSTDAEKKEFLMPLLGLDDIERALESLESDTSACAKEVEKMATIVQLLDSKAQSVIDLSADIERAKSEYESLAAKAALPTIASSPEMAPLQAEKHKIMQMLSVATSSASGINSLKQTAFNIKAQIEKLEDSKCPTCARQWDESTSKIDQYKQELSQVLDTIKQKTHLAATESTIRAALQEIEQKITSIVQAQSTAEAQWQSVQAQKNMAQRLLGNLMQQAKEQSDNKAQLLKAREALAAGQKRLETLSQARLMLGKDGFLGEIVEETLKEIQSRINGMLVKIPNVSEISVAVSSTSVSKAGVSKKSISVSIFKRGREISFKALSGGQQSSLELCADLAVREVAYNRSPVKIGWTALDEAMDGLDVVNKQAAVEVIKENVKGMVLIIDHATEVKEGFEKIIEVNYDGIRSTIEAA